MPLLKYLAERKKDSTFVAGEMAEWSIAAVLKTVELRGSGGSNPSLSAIQQDCCILCNGLLFYTCVTLQINLTATRYKTIMQWLYATALLNRGEKGVLVGAGVAEIIVFYFQRYFGDGFAVRIH